MTTPAASLAAKPSVSALTTSRGLSGPARTILAGGLTVAVLDILDAIVFFGTRGVTPLRVFQSVAAGLLGKTAYHGELATAGLGAVLHCLIALTIVTIYYLVSRVWEALVRRPVSIGLAYGVVCYFVMSFVVVPLSAAGRPLSWPVAPVLLNGILGHALLIGLPAALFSRRAAQRAAATATGG